MTRTHASLASSLRPCLARRKALGFVPFFFRYVLCRFVPRFFAPPSFLRVCRFPVPRAATRVLSPLLFAASKARWLQATPNPEHLSAARKFENEFGGESLLRSVSIKLALCRPSCLRYSKFTEFFLTDACFGRGSFECLSRAMASPRRGNDYLVLSYFPCSTHLFRKTDTLNSSFDESRSKSIEYLSSPPLDPRWLDFTAGRLVIDRIPRLGRSV